MDKDHHSSDSPLEPWVDPALEARLVALILGEASEFEKAELLSAIDSQPELKAFYERIKGTHRALELAESPTHSDTGSSWKLPPAKREALLERFRSPAEGATPSAPIAEPVSRRRTRLAPWLGIAAAAALLMVTMIPLTLTRRDLAIQAQVMAQSQKEAAILERRSWSFENQSLDQIALERDTGDVQRISRASEELGTERYSRPNSSLESLALVDSDSDSKDQDESPTTWGRFGNSLAWRQPGAGETAEVDSSSADGWEQGISLAKNPRGFTEEGRSVASFAVTAEPSQPNFVADGGVVAAINGAVTEPSPPQQWGAKTDAYRTNLYSGISRFDPEMSGSGSRLAAYGEDSVELAQTIPQPDALGETASESDEKFDGTKAYYKMPTGGRRFRSSTPPVDTTLPPSEDLTLDLVEQSRVVSDAELKSEGATSVTREHLATTFEDQSRPAIGLGMEFVPPPSPEPAAGPSAPADETPVNAAGFLVTGEDRAGGFASASGVVTGFAVLDEFAAPEPPSSDPTSSDDPFASVAEGMDLAEASGLAVQPQVYAEGEKGAAIGGGIGGGGIGGGGGQIGTREESLQGPGQETAQQRALYDEVARFDEFARDFGEGEAEPTAGTPFATTVTADFGWDSRPTIVTRATAGPTRGEEAAKNWAETQPVEGAARLAGDWATQKMDDGVAIQSAFGASLPQPESGLSRRLVEAEISQYGSEQNEAKLVDVLKSTNALAKVDKFSVSTNGKTRGLGSLGLGDSERSQEHFTDLDGDSLSDQGNVDGTVQMFSLAGQLDGEDSTATVEQQLAAVLRTDQSEETEEEASRGGQGLVRFFSDSSFDRELAIPELNGRWEADAAAPGWAGSTENAPIASGGSEVAQANRPAGTESSWYDFDVDTPGKEITDLAARRLMAGELQDGLAVAGVVEIEELREKQSADLTTANLSRGRGLATTPAEPSAGSIVMSSKPGEADAEAQLMLDGRQTVANRRGSALRNAVGKKFSKVPDEQILSEELIAKDSERVKAKPDHSLETLTSAEPFSTFSLNVSDVSFKLAKTALLENNSFPDSTKVRVEEFVNAFDYGDPSPSLNEKVACHIDQSAHPFLQQRNLMRISMQTAAEGRAASQPLRLTILLDKSGSMERADREESVLRTMQALATHLGAADTITAVAFARQPHLIADRLSGDRAEELVGLVAATPSEGGTNLEEALALADKLATRQFEDDAINRIVLITDGAANLGDADPESLKEKVSELRQRGIAFDACGVGANGLNDTTLEALTRKGDGRYYFLNRPQDADTKFVRQLAGALRPAAKNVKVQVKFNPERVTRYRLAGFEKHRLKKEDFRNDKVDAAEMAAAESGNALYQFEAAPQGSGDVGEVAVRFLDTSTGKMVERSWPIPYQPEAPRLGEASSAMQLAATAGLLGEKLKGGPSSETIVLGDLAPVTNQLRAEFEDDQEVQQLLQMFEAARGLTGQ